MALNHFELLGRRKAVRSLKAQCSGLRLNGSLGSRRRRQLWKLLHNVIHVTASINSPRPRQKTSGNSRTGEKMAFCVPLKLMLLMFVHFVVASEC